jgi:outer membrane receptor for monomeric catechols
MFWLLSCTMLVEKKSKQTAIDPNRCHHPLITQLNSDNIHSCSSLNSASCIENFYFTWYIYQFEKWCTINSWYVNRKKEIQSPPTHIVAFQTNIFSWFNDTVIKSQWFLGLEIRRFDIKHYFFHFINLTWPPQPQKEKI